MATKSCYNCFKILSDKNRTGIIFHLQKGEKKVNDLLEKFKIGQPTVSYHLKRLKRYGLVKTKKRGREIFYSLNQKYVCKNCRVFQTIKT